MQGVQINSTTVRNVVVGEGGKDGIKRPNNQPAGIRKQQYTLAGGQGRAVMLLSPSPATVGPSDRSAGQRNRRRRRGGQRNDRTIQQSTVGYGGEGGR